MLKRFWAGLEFPHFFRSQNQQSVILAGWRSGKAFDRLIFRPLSSRDWSVFSLP